VEAEPVRQLADPPATWQEHWFDHRQLPGLYHSDEHCAIYVDPGVRRAEVQWLPGFINVTWQYSKATYGGAFGSDPRIYSIHHAGRHGGGHAGYYVQAVLTADGSETRLSHRTGRSTPIRAGRAAVWGPLNDLSPLAAVPGSCWSVRSQVRHSMGQLNQWLAGHLIMTPPRGPSLAEW
jgi:hypothetical protein